MRRILSLALPLAVALVAGYALLNREGEDTQSLLERGQGSGGAATVSGEPPQARGVPQEQAGDIAEVVALVASNQEPCDYFTEDALARFTRPGRVEDSYEACLAAERGERRIEASQVRVVSISGDARRASVRFEAAERRGSARLVNEDGQWLITRIRP